MNRTNNAKQCFTILKHTSPKALVLATYIKPKPLVRSITIQDHSLVVLLAQQSIEGNENALYYLNRTLVAPEERYSLLRRCGSP